MASFRMFWLVIPLSLSIAGSQMYAESDGPAAMQREVQPESPGSPLVAWIWQSAEPGESERVFFRREFQLPPNVVAASVSIVCDNWHHIFINGVDLGMGADWSQPASYDVVAHLNLGGKNLIAVEGRNEGGAAGMALRFSATLKDGKKLTVVSDGSWQCANDAADGWQNLGFSAAAWPKAVAVAKMGDTPWGPLMPPEPEELGLAKVMTGALHVAPDFKLKPIYQVPTN